MRIVIEGQDFSVTARPGTSGVYDFDHSITRSATGYFRRWPDGQAEKDETIRDFLADINPATGFLA